MTAHRYLVALGSNVRHPRYGNPRSVIAAALAALDKAGARVEVASPVIASVPLGPSRRRYANAAAVIASALAPEGLLDVLQAIERDFGRRRRGARWGARVLDLDLILWSGGAWASDRLVVPHPLFRRRAFVLRPAAAIAPEWRDPLTGLTLAHLHARLTRGNPLA
ncbi:2-amino-4-hydroxy-6-hydroxymethyldihydropteridine diphosphokinase [Tsuneonella sp. YG55]|uniref:2-amino-4-hydroxy-6-hydroxymethyldihydropteridine pyrophosphokinase n=1 Tax=Tsuneonella litorea TaxID=2976475 RepID=A0A9X2VYT9_9SPHN|nr:2-amino-4-hydroxy-6-hydroxymethyldihydropteridine diphosphokinase [Tsuneonella litorea]MCT2557548.1 2-amino-4-hydroxy-6-hydroxymethyldihydropteridine diphosphokinase [Tsuneonella litorea]